MRKYGNGSEFNSDDDFVEFLQKMLAELDRVERELEEAFERSRQLVDDIQFWEIVETEKRRDNG